MAHHDVDEVHVEDVEDVGLALPDFDLLHEGLQKDVYGDVLELVDDVGEVVQHELPHVGLLVVFNEQEGQFLVDDRGVGVLTFSKLVK